MASGYQAKKSSKTPKVPSTGSCASYGRKRIEHDAVMRSIRYQEAIIKKAMEDIRRLRVEMIMLSADIRVAKDLVEFYTNKLEGKE